MKFNPLYLLTAVMLLSSCAHPLPVQSSGIQTPSFWGRIIHSNAKSQVDFNSIVISFYSVIEEDLLEANKGKIVLFFS